MPSRSKCPKPATSLRSAHDEPAPEKPRRAAVVQAGNSEEHATPEAEGLDEPRLLQTLMAVKAGDFSVRLPVDRTGMSGKIYDALNEIISLNQRQSRELERLSEVVGRQGKLRQRATFPSASGEWAATMEAVNALITHLVQPWADVDRVISAVAKGDLSQSMALETEGRALTGEFQRTAKTVNTMVGQLGTFASEVTRVAREVGTEGKLGGQAQVKGVAGT